MPTMFEHRSNSNKKKHSAFFVTVYSEHCYSLHENTLSKSNGSNITLSLRCEAIESELLQLHRYAELLTLPFECKRRNVKNMSSVYYVLSFVSDIEWNKKYNFEYFPFDSVRFVLRIQYSLHIQKSRNSILTEVNLRWLSFFRHKTERNYSAQNKCI